MSQLGGRQYKNNKARRAKASALKDGPHNIETNGKEDYPDPEPRSDESAKNRIAKSMKRPPAFADTRYDVGVWTLCFVAIAAFTNALQWHTQTKTMRLEQRPWLKPEIGTKDDKPFNFVVGEKLAIPWTLTNIGKTPAQEVTAYLFVELVNRGEEPHLPTRGARMSGIPGYFNTAFPDSPMTGSVVRFYPAKEAGERAQIQPLTPQEAQALSEKNAYIAVYGTIKYIDIFGMRHATNICRNVYISGEDAGSVTCTRDGNYTQNDE